MSTVAAPPKQASDRAFDVAFFLLYTLIPAVLESEWVDGAELIKSSCAPFGSLYGQHTDDPQALYPDWVTLCADPLVDAGGALAGEYNVIGTRSAWRFRLTAEDGSRIDASERAQNAITDLSDWWVDAGAVLAMCRERSPDVTDAVLQGWST